MEPRTDRRNQVISGIVIIAIILIGIAYFASKAPPTPSVNTTASSTAATATISSSTTPNITVVGNKVTTNIPGYTITPVYASSSVPTAPNYKAPFVFSASGLDANAEASMQTQFAQIQATLSKSPIDFNSWIALGGLRKDAGDYAGAEADWQYMSTIYPTNIVSNANLADLYTNYLHEYAKAAVAYKAAIKNDPTQTYLYDNLFSLYTNQYPQSPAVITAMLKAGIAANPNATELKADLAKYQ